VLVGNGADELIRMCAALTLEAGAAAVFPCPAFPSYRDSVQCCGARPIPVAAGDEHLVDALLDAAADPAVALLYLANPDNPTGRLLPPAEITRLAAQAPGRTLCVVDEAYAHYAGEAADAIDLVAAGAENVCVLRTFSKVYGLAGLRIGYAVAHPGVIAALERIRLVFNVSQPAQLAALAALDEDACVADRVERTRRGRVRLHHLLAQAGLDPLPSRANFVFARVPGGDGAAFAHELLLQGVAVRALAGFGAPDAIRVTVGTPAELRFLAGALDQMRVEVRL
jgi:histidinol-phosphate aminotransferase